MSSRKYLRIALNEADQRAFEDAKESAQEASGIEMSDSMFALSVIRRAIRKHGEPSS